MRNDQIHYKKVEQLEDFVGTPLPNEQFRIITQKQFNAYTILLHLFKTTEIEEMNLAIFRINQPTVESLSDYILSNKIKQANILVCSYFHQTKKPEQWAEQLRDFCRSNPHKCRYAYVNLHAKVIACKTTDNNYYVFEGSGNMTANGLIEQYVYDNNKQVYEHHRRWIIEMITKEEKKRKL